MCRHPLKEYNDSNRMAGFAARRAVRPSHGYGGALSSCQPAMRVKSRCPVEFKTNEMVVHPKYGIGCVVRLGPRAFGPNSAQEYYEIAISTGTIWVPAGDPSHGLRRVTTSTDLSRCRKVLAGQAVPLATDSKQRKTDLAERMKPGTFESRCEVLRDLCAQRSRKPLDESSGALLRKVRELLCAEWAAAEGLSLEEAAQEVDALIIEGQQLSNGTSA